MDRTAIIICNYNMPERTDALCEHILETVKVPYDLIVVDNGSDLVPPSEYTTLHLPDNKQTGGGFLAGLANADVIGEYKYYWLMITSAEFIREDKRDPLPILIDVMNKDGMAYAVQPSIHFTSKEAWSKWLEPRKKKIARRIWGVDYISTLFRAEYFNAIGRFRKELPMMWGTIGECNYKARKAGYHIYVHDGYTMRKITDIGYTMNRMNMSSVERRDKATREANAILEPIYGVDYREKFRYEYIQKGVHGEY